MKKCSIAELQILFLIGLCASLGFFGQCLASSSAEASLAPSIGQALKQDLQGRQAGSFNELLKSWTLRYGTGAFSPLLEIARNSKNADPDRYVALMGAAKLGGTQTAPLFVHFLQDNSWMIRNGALRALSALENPEASRHVLPLLKDPALVVRLEAVEAITRLKPPGSAEALVTALLSPENYRLGKAQWVPQRALSALQQLRAQGGKELAPRLKPLLDHDQDPEFQRLVLRTLEVLSDHPVALDLPLAERIKRWKTQLTSG